MRRRVGAFDIINISILLFFCVACLYPFLYITVLSFNDATDATKGGIYLWPRMFSLANYKAIFNSDTILVAYEVTVLRVLLTIVLHVFLCALFAYSMSKPTFKGRRFCNWLIVIPMYFWGGIIPYYMVLQTIGLLNSFWTYIIPGLYSTFNIMVLITAIKQIPTALEESARIDGAIEPVIFFRITLPLMRPALAAIALFVGVGAWNDWYTGFTFITNTKLWCAQNVLLHLLNSNEASNIAQIAKFRKGIKITVTAESVKMAMLIVTTAPVMLIYPFLQKYFIKGVMIGSLKG